MPTPAVAQALSWRAGDPARVTVRVVDADGVPVSLAGSTWTAQVRQDRERDVLATMTTDATDAATGVLVFTLSGVQTRAIRDAGGSSPHIDVEGSAHGTLVAMRAVIERDVTRVPDGEGGIVEPTGGLGDVLDLLLTGTTVEVVAQSVVAFGTDDQTAAEVPFTPAGSIEATDVQAAIVELDSDLIAEGESRADADAALDGRVGAIEGDYLQAADITGMETTVGAQAKADAAQEYAVQRANHSGVQPSTTISDFAEAVQDAVAGLLGAGSNVVLTYDDASDTLTIDATGDGTGLDAEAVRDAIGVALVGVGLISVVVNDAADTITISTTATANSTDAALRDRATHTGVQAIATVTGLQAALDAKAPLASPALSGTPTAPTPAAGDDSTKIATTAHVKTAVDNATSDVVRDAELADYAFLSQSGGTMTGRLVTRSVRETVHDLGSPASGTVNVDPANGTIQKATPSGAITLAWANWADGDSVLLRIEGANALTWPAGTRFVGGEAPAVEAGSNVFSVWRESAVVFVTFVGAMAAP